MAKQVVYVLSNLQGNIAQCLEKAVPSVIFKSISCKNIQFTDTDLLELKSEKCQIIVADPPVIAKLMHDVPHLRWAQGTFAGVDAIMKNKDNAHPSPGFTLTRFGGVFGVPMAEYVLGQIIARERKFIDMFHYQKRKKWDMDAFCMYRPLSKLSIVILGLGDIGRDIARMCKCFRMTVKALVRKVPAQTDRLPYVDEYREMSDAGMASVFSESDYICSVLPSTPQTNDILGDETALKACKNKQSVLINVGRGNVIKEETLIHALKEKWLGGAVLDVFNTEPLPEDSELWSMENVIISPHTATQSFDWQIAEVFKKNYEKFLKREQLDYQVNWNRGY